MYMKIYLPDDIASYEAELRFFMELMVRKLHLNRHKGFADNALVYSMLDLLESEFKELQFSLKHGSQFEVSLEAVDVANMAFLLSLVALRLTKKDFEDARR